MNGHQELQSQDSALSAKRIIGINDETDSRHQTTDWQGEKRMSSLARRNGNKKYYEANRERILKKRKQKQLEKERKKRKKSSQI